MTEPGSPAWPVLPDELRIPDDALAAAYTSLGDVERSWIKRNIAQLYALHPPRGTDHASTRTCWSGGLRTTTTRFPRPWACMVSPGCTASAENGSDSLASPGPAGVAAALVPVMTAGITDILAILHPSVPQSAHLLTTLELCGVEHVYVVSPEGISRQLQALVAWNPSGLILDMGGVAPCDPLTKEPASRTNVWRPGLVRLRVWCAATGQWDWSTLKWNHPRTHVEAWGPFRDAAPDQILQVDGNWDAFCRCQGAALGVGADMLHAPYLSGLPRSGLILTPGQEGCWYWPDLDPDSLCCQHGMVLSGDQGNPPAI